MDLSLLTDPTKLVTKNKDKIVSGLKKFQGTLRTDAEVAADKEQAKSVGQALKLPEYKPGPFLSEEAAQIGKTLTAPFTGITAPVEAGRALQKVFREGGGYTLKPFGFTGIEPPTEEEKARGEALFKPAADWLSDRASEVGYVFSQPNVLSEAVKPFIEPVLQTKTTVDKYMAEDEYQKIKEGYETGNVAINAWNYVTDPSYRAYLAVKREGGDRAVETYSNFVKAMETGGGDNAIAREAFKAGALGVNYLVDLLERPMRKTILPQYFNMMFNLSSMLRSGEVTKEDFERNKLAASYVAGGPVDYAPKLLNAGVQILSNPILLFKEAKGLVDDMFQTETGYRESLKKEHPELQAWDYQDIFGVPMLSIFDTAISYAAGIGEALITPYMTSLGLQLNSKAILTGSKVLSTAQQTIYPTALTTLAASKGWLGQNVKDFIDQESAKDADFGQAMSVLSGMAILSTFFKGTGVVLKPFKKVSLLDQLQNFEKQYEKANNDPEVVKQMVEDFKRKFEQNVEVYKRKELGKSGGITAEQINELFSQWKNIPAAIQTKLQDLTLKLFYRMAEEGGAAGYYKEQAKALGINTDTLTTKYGSGTEFGQVIYHEFAHAIERGVMNDPVFGPMWNALTAKVQFENVKGTTAPAKTYGEYKYANAGEYFAENFRTFIKNPTYLKATDPAMYDFMGKVNERIGEAMDVGKVTGGTEFAPRTEIQKNLSNAILNGTEEPVYFGNISQAKLDEINAIRKTLGQPELTSKELYVFPRVVQKLRTKRINIDKLTPDEVADIAYSAVYNKDSKVTSTRYPQIQALMTTKEGRANFAFVGKTADDLSSLKSTYPVKYGDIQNTLGRKGVNSAPTLSQVQGDINKLAETGDKVNTPSSSDTKFSPRLKDDLAPLYEEARKYKSAEEFVEGINNKNFNRISENLQEIGQIQSMRHQLHSLDAKDIFNTGSGNSNDLYHLTKDISETIERLNLTGDEEGVAEKLWKIADNTDRPSDMDFDFDDVYGDLVKKVDNGEIPQSKLDEYIDNYTYESLSKINDEKEVANNIIEDYLKKIDDQLRKYGAEDIDIPSKFDGYLNDNSFAPTGFARARSLLGEGDNNTAKGHIGDIQYSKEQLAGIWDQAQKNTPEANVSQRDVSAMPRYKSPEGDDVDLQAFTYKSRNANNLSPDNNIVNKAGDSEYMPRMKDGFVREVNNLLKENGFPQRIKVENADISKLNPLHEVGSGGQEWAYIKDLTSSINSKGVQQPLVVDDDGTTVLNGSHRLHALWNTDLSTVPVYKIVNGKLSDLPDNILERFDNIYERYGGDIEFMPRLKQGGAVELPSGKTAEYQVLAETGGVQTPPTIQKNLRERGFNMDQLNLNPKEATRVAEVASAMGLGDYKVRTWDDVEKMAQELLSSPDDLLINIKTSKLNDYEMQALKDMISTNQKFISENADKLSGLETKDPKQAQLLKDQLAHADDQINKALQKLLPASTEAGRALNAHKLWAKNTLDPTTWYMRAQKALGERKLTVEQKQEISGLINEKNLNGLSVYVMGLEKPTWAEIVSSLYKAGLLTSPSTHIANLGSNTVMGIGEGIINDYIGAPIDKLVSVFTGKRTISYVGILKRLGYIPDGLAKAYDQVKYGYDPSTRGEIFKEIRTGNKIVDTYLKVIFRTLSAEDKVYKQVAYDSSVYSQSKAQALNEGLKLNSPEFKVRVDELKTDTGITTKATNEALFATFNRDNIISDIVGKARSYLGEHSKAGYLATQVVAPFVRTPTNVALAAIDYSPLGLIKTIANTVKGDQRAAILSFGRALTGSSFIGLGAYLNSQGMMTGTYPSGGEDKKYFQTHRVRPGNLIINGMQFDLMRLSPMGNLLQLGAAMSENYKDNQDVLKTLSTAGMEGLKGLTEQTFLLGVSKTLQAVQGGGYAENWVETMVSGWIPTVIAQLAESSDQYQREINSVKDALFYRIPGLRQTLLPKRDVLGKKMTTNDEEMVKIEDWPGFVVKSVKRLFDPLKAGKVYSNELIDEYDRQFKMGYEKVYPTIPSDSRTLSTKVTVDGKNEKISIKFKMTPEEYNEFQKIRGALLYDNEVRLIQTEAYKAMTEDQKASARDKIERTATEAAFESMRAVFNQNHPEIQKEFEKQYDLLTNR
ncbi:MAG: hypothetical protein A4E53_01730 [Pelotomaculum sp. PtaB.Bin104]|nr:MAG: hypothetical protein A4E53_01730 [Pelotomaculum sp. PtaB.Bin104]